MKFTFEEWGKIKHALEVARNEYEKQMQTSTPNDDQYCSYQIFKRQMADVDGLLHKLVTAEI